MDDYIKRIKYFCIGEFASIMMLRGIIHPDMQENNLGFKNGVVKTVDFANIVPFDYTKGIDLKLMKKLSNTLFPPMDKILKDFYLMSSFRAGFMAIGGVLGKHVFDLLENSGINSFAYVHKEMGALHLQEHQLDFDEIKSNYDEWQKLLTEKLFEPNTGKIMVETLDLIRDSVGSGNKYYAEQLILLKKYVGQNNEENSKCLLKPALQFALESVKKGYVYTGYGIMKKMIHLHGAALQVVIDYTNQINKLLEGHNLDDRIMSYIEACMGYDLMELIWVVNDIDRHTYEKTPTI